MPLQHKIIFGYIILVAVIGSMIAILIYERRQMRVYQTRKVDTENSRREVEKCSVHRSGSSAHEGPHKGLVVSKKADLAHEVFTRSKVVRKKEANHARRSRVCRRRFNVLGQDWSSALRISAARAGETSLERSSMGAAAMRATEP